MGQVYCWLSPDVPALEAGTKSRTVSCEPTGDCPLWESLLSLLGGHLKQQSDLLQVRLATSCFPESLTQD